MVVVGSAALWLHEEPLAVHDLDIVLAPQHENFLVAVSALAVLGTSPADLPPLPMLQSAQLLSVATGYGGVDLMLERGRRSYADLAGGATIVDVYGAKVRIASREDAWALRARFKQRESAS